MLVNGHFIHLVNPVIQLKIFKAKCFELFKLINVVLVLTHGLLIKYDKFKSNHRWRRAGWFDLWLETAPEGYRVLDFR